MVGSRAAVGTPCAGQMPVILRSGEVESERGRTVEALAGFIGAGAGAGTCGGTGSACRGAVRAGPSAGACSGAPERVKHVGICFCPCSNAC
jgi:hypothetical protein